MSTEEGLKRDIGLWGFTSNIINIVIGSGIFVLPALVPELSYDDLEINNGSDASTIFYNLKSEEDELVQKRTRINLLNYCKLDTLAMVKLFEKINEI